MEQSLAYLREILSGHTDSGDAVGDRLYHIVSSDRFSSEETFVDALTAEENDYLNQILSEAIHYSKQEGDFERSRQLNKVYELLFTY
ncbi:sporulation protein [Peribacillus sp. SCS-37]|uniref:sporulation protein n=1 Tax=Paraperibacillus esterisolvens TaxID=3115296 RepID=UPI003905D297